MRLAGYGLEDACRTNTTPNERPILERVDGRNGTTYHCLEADFRYGSNREELNCSIRSACLKRAKRDIATPHAISASAVEQREYAGFLILGGGDQFAQCCSLVLVSYQSKQGMPNYARPTIHPTERQPLRRMPNPGADQITKPPRAKLTVNDHGPLSILAISFDSCNRLWRFKFTFFDNCCVPVRLRTVLGRSHRVGGD